jgi:O-antigen ligase
VPEYPDRVRADRLRPERATQAALATTIVLVVFGSSGEHDLRAIGSPLRWVALALLAISAIVWAAGQGVRSRRFRLAELFALMLCTVSVASAAWSIVPRISLERSCTFLVVLVAASAVAAASSGVAGGSERTAATIVFATVGICLAGVVVYAVNPAIGAQAAAPGIAFRFSGLGENPNTIPMLATVAVPLAAWLAFVRSRRGRVLACLALVVFAAEIIASGSRGAIVGAVAAAAVLVAALPVRGRKRALLALVALLVCAMLVLGNRLIQNATALPLRAASATAGARETPLPRPILPAFVDERGTLSFQGRALIGNDGRLGAWQEALDEGDARPLTGFGFGTEQEAFVDRLAQFHASRPENSYFGLYLELGTAGALLFLAFGIGIAVGVFRARLLESHARRAAVAGASAGVASGYGLAFGQSFVYAAGNIAMLSFWVVAFLALALAAPRARVRISTAVAIAIVIAVALVPIGRWERSRAIAHQQAGIARLWKTVGGRVDAPALDGFRLSPPVDCLLYHAPAFELCFDGGRLVEAYDRRDGFHGWTLQQYGYTDAPVTVDPAAVRHAFRTLGAFGAGIGVGPAYLARRNG